MIVPAFYDQLFFCLTQIESFLSIFVFSHRFEDLPINFGAFFEFPLFVESSVEELWM